MKLPFKTHFADGSTTNFVEKILTGLEMLDSTYIEDIRKAIRLGHYDSTCFYEEKIHTIRASNTKFKEGTPVHFVIHNRTKNRYQFARTGKVYSTQHIAITNNHFGQSVKIDGVELLPSEIDRLAIADGFYNTAAFFNFFGQQNFEGVLIHWTPFKYEPMKSYLPKIEPLDYLNLPSRSEEKKSPT